MINELQRAVIESLDTEYDVSTQYEKDGKIYCKKCNELISVDNPFYLIDSIYQ